MNIYDDLQSVTYTTLWYDDFQMNSKTRKPELVIISGCLEGLNSSLVNFTESAEEGMLEKRKENVC